MGLYRGSNCEILPGVWVRRSCGARHIPYRHCDAEGIHDFGSYNFGRRVFKPSTLDLASAPESLPIKMSCWLLPGPPKYVE